MYNIKGGIQQIVLVVWDKITRDLTRMNYKSVLTETRQEVNSNLILGRITQQSTALLTENERNFFKAASGRNLGLIRFYLNNGININLLDEDRTSPL